jgi:hypothetical protein
MKELNMSINKDQVTGARAPRMIHTLITLLVLLTALSANAQGVPKKPVRRAPPLAPLVLPPAPGEQLAATAMTYFGDYACEFDQSLQVSLNPRFDGYVDVRFGKQLHTMKPVLSQTGALRLEDVRGRLMLLQIGVKSMLFDVKSGHRLVDECVHERQAENRRAIAAAPTQPGLGIEPGRATDAAAAEAAAAASAPASAPITPAAAGR